ncbi:hypothetical protein MP228_012890 [Amoeboaphelidium protococcarum]|nr:hypothetical protein MP228_012890 [Amoeboaphelidium protococcarum]
MVSQQTRNKIVSYTSGALMATALFLLIDASVLSQYYQFDQGKVTGVIWVPFIIHLIAFIIVNAVPADAIEEMQAGNVFSEDTKVPSFWLFLGFLMSFCAIFAATYIMIVQYIINSPQPPSSAPPEVDQRTMVWPGVAVFLQNVFIFRRGTLFWTAAVSAGVYFAGQYAKSKIDEMMLKSELDRYLKDNIKKRFTQNQQDVILTLLSYLPSITEQLMAEMDVESLTLKLRNLSAQSVQQDNFDHLGIQSRQPEESDEEWLKRVKAAYWDRLKQFSIARTIAALYIYNLFHLLLQVQLNMVGRYTYLESLEAIDADKVVYPVRSGDIDGNVQAGDPNHHRTKLLSAEVEKQYLSLSYYFMNVGMKQIVDMVLLCTKDVFSEVALSQKLSHDDLIQKVSLICEQVDTQLFDGDTPQVQSLLFPSLDPLNSDDEVGIERWIKKSLYGEQVELSAVNVEVSQQLIDLCKETVDLLQSRDASIALQDTLKASQDHLKQLYLPEDQVTAMKTSSKEHITKVEDDTVDGPSIVELQYSPLALHLPKFARLTHNILTPFPNTLAKVLDKNCNDMKAFCAVIYTTDTADVDAQCFHNEGMSGGGERRMLNEE